VTYLLGGAAIAGNSAPAGSGASLAQARGPPIAIVGAISMAMCFAALRGRVKRSSQA